MTNAINREDVIRMAKESGFKACVGTTDKEGNYHPFVNALGKDIPIEWLERFAALAALRARPAGWIAVSERLPKPWDAVMVHPRPNDYVNEAYLNHKGVWMYSEYVTDFGDQAYPCVVTHWMPLPPPPGQERAQPDHSELVKDAARYRWLREQHWSDSKFAVVSNPKTAVNLGSICPSRELLDEAIDEAMAAIGEET